MSIMKSSQSSQSSQSRQPSQSSDQPASDRLIALEQRLNKGSQIDMLSQPEIISSKRVYQGRIFAVDDQTIALRQPDGGSVRIGRQIVRHAHSVVMMVHDVAQDTYLLEREYRVGSNSYAYGFPAGLCDPHESSLQSAFRELREETGIVIPGIPNKRSDPAFTADSVEHAADVSTNIDVDIIGDFYSSVGMTDELTTVMVFHLHRFSVGEREFDPDEHVESGWVTWDDLLHTVPIRSTNTVLAIQHEHIRRLTQQHHASPHRA
jgi:ADP-ribose pyrophosphatase